MNPPAGRIQVGDRVTAPGDRSGRVVAERLVQSNGSWRYTVALDGGGTLGELLTLRACSGVTVADLTVRNVRWNGIKLDSDRDVQRVTIRNCILQNIWQRAIKGVKVPAADREATRPRDCVVEYCLFTNDRPKRLDPPMPRLLGRHDAPRQLCGSGGQQQTLRGHTQPMP